MPGEALHRRSCHSDLIRMCALCVIWCMIIVFSPRMSNTLPCPLCGFHGQNHLSELMRHIRLFHADESNFKIDCTLQGCCRTFTNYLTYRNHVYAFHSTSTGELFTQQVAPIFLNQWMMKLPVILSILFYHMMMM